MDVKTINELEKSLGGEPHPENEHQKQVAELCGLARLGYIAGADGARKTFVRGEISALTWIITIKSLTPNERSHIVKRLQALKDFIDGKLAADFDGTQERWIPDFYTGENKPQGCV